MGGSLFLPGFYAGIRARITQVKSAFFAPNQRSLFTKPPVKIVQTAYQKNGGKDHDSNNQSLFQDNSLHHITILVRLC